MPGLTDLIPPVPDLAVGPLLPAMAEQAAAADRTRTIDPHLIEQLKASDVVRLAATAELGGVEAPILDIGRELEAMASACASTAWVMWNHLAVFHLFVGCLGPRFEPLLGQMVTAGETVCFPAGASSGVRGRIDGDHVTLDGKGAFGSGGRYADWAGVAFIVVDEAGDRVEPIDIRFTILRLDQSGIEIDPTWDGASVRASATDDVRYTGVTVPLDRCVPWYGANRAEALREIPVVAPRYREDWVGLSDIWLAWMGVGVVGAALADVIAETGARRTILGKAMESHPTVQRNLGQVTALVTAAAATAETACRQVDERIEAGIVPTEADYLRQMALGSSALAQLDDAVGLLRRTLGGNGLRESGSFDRRFRDFQAMPIHINAHPDRVALRLGRHLLDETQDPF